MAVSQQSLLDKFLNGVNQNKTERVKPRRKEVVAPSIKASGSSPKTSSLPQRQVIRLLDEDTTTLLRKAMKLSPMIQPSAMVDGMILRHEWIEEAIEETPTLALFDVKVNPNYKPINSATTNQCKYCVWQHLCNVVPNSPSCDFESPEVSGGEIL